MNHIRASLLRLGLNVQVIALKSMLCTFEPVFVHTLHISLYFIWSRFALGLCTLLKELVILTCFLCQIFRFGVAVMKYNTYNFSLSPLIFFAYFA